MPRFFTREIADGHALITGEDAHHIGRALRMAVGEEVTVCDLAGSDYRARIASVTADSVLLDLLEQTPCRTEPSLRLRLFQAVPKGDKLELIVQKAVELGVAEVIPFLSSRCIARPDLHTMEKKAARYNRIMQEAAKQCGRGILPVFGELCSFEQAVEEMRRDEAAIFFYEEATDPLRRCIPQDARSLSIMIGSEGGFSAEEAQLVRAAGISSASLGPRILRCETAGIAALSAILYQTGNF